VKAALVSKMGSQPKYPESAYNAVSLELRESARGHAFKRT
jgi:hypothetical protein